MTKEDTMNSPYRIAVPGTYGTLLAAGLVAATMLIVSRILRSRHLENEDQYGPWDEFIGI
jgi:hypothetical protein